MTILIARQEYVLQGLCRHHPDATQLQQKQEELHRINDQLVQADRAYCQQHGKDYDDTYSHERSVQYKSLTVMFVRALNRGELPYMSALLSKQVQLVHDLPPLREQIRADANMMLDAALRQISQQHGHALILWHSEQLAHCPAPYDVSDELIASQTARLTANSSAG